MLLCRQQIVTDHISVYIAELLLPESPKFWNSCGGHLDQACIHHFWLHKMRIREVLDINIAAAKDSLLTSEISEDEIEN